MSRRLLCFSGHVDNRLRETGNTSPGAAELRHQCNVDVPGARPSRSSLFAPPPTARECLPTSPPSSTSFRVPPQRLQALGAAAGRMLSPTEAVHEGRRVMAPPNVTVVQGLGPFGSHPPASPPAPPASSMLSYLYQSGLYSAAAAAAAQQQQQHLPVPFAAAHRPPHHSLDGVAVAAPFLHTAPPPPVSAPDVPAAGFPFAAAPAELTSAGLVAAAAAAAGLHLNPAALMLSAAGQLAAHPWLYPGYLAAAAAALGQSAVAVALHPAASDIAASVASSPSSPSTAGRHRHHHLVSSSSRFAPYPAGGDRHHPASGRSTPAERSPTVAILPRAASPLPAPDTTDSPPAAEAVSSPSPPSANSPAVQPSSHSAAADCDDPPSADRGQLKNMEQMVNGLDHVIKARIVTSSSSMLDASSNDVDVMDVDSSKI